MITIRPATIADAPSIAEVHVASWCAAYRDLMPESVLASQSVTERTSFWANDIASNLSRVLVAEANDSIAGLLSIAHTIDADAETGTLEILALYVAPSSWSKGVGRSLCAAADSFAGRHGGTLVTLWALTGNARAHRFYFSVGFRQQPGTTRPYQRHGLSLQQVRYAKPIAG